LQNPSSLPGWFGIVLSDPRVWRSGESVVKLQCSTLPIAIKGKTRRENRIRKGNQMGHIAEEILRIDGMILIWIWLGWSFLV
jgi:hypothetical protein